MNYCGLNLCDTANGPGIRVSLFVSGCRLHCKGCFNKNSWDFNYGSKFTDETKKIILDNLKKDYISGFSLLGGDPFEPENREILLDLLKDIAKIGKPSWVWTGRLYESVRNLPIIDYIDVLVDGPFMINLKEPGLKYRGSLNQRILYLKEIRDVSKNNR